MPPLLGNSEGGEMMRGMDSNAPAIKALAVDLPGLFDIECPDGMRMFDMTVGQVESIARQNGWRIECVTDLSATDA